MEMELGEAVWGLEGGYCLWVGAGLTRQVASGQAAVPLWDELTRELESEAGVRSSKRKDFPNRLDACASVLGEARFRRFLRERYYTNLCGALLSQALRSLEAEDFVPDCVRAVAALGQLANPIVSFNVEPLSTLLAARPAGPVRILFQQPPGRPRHTWREPGGHFQRLAYHPHGLATADAVMTASQYRANRQTLAFRVAIHAAFRNTLAIVGMSLDDRYLRRQIEQFRDNIDRICWFNSNFSDRLASWAHEQRITIVRAPWDSFWQQWRGLGIEIDPTELAAAWYLAISEATKEAEGGTMGSLERSLRAAKSSDRSSDFGRLAARLAEAGASAGEPGKELLIDGREPREIELALRERLTGAGISIPIITEYFEPMAH